jgi:hypothetical protein
MEGFVEGLLEIFRYSPNIGKSGRDKVDCRDISQRGSEGVQLSIEGLFVFSTYRMLS